MKPYIADLVPNEEITSYFLISDAPIVRKSKKGTDYLCIKLFDKTGDVDARLWEIPKDLEVSALKKVIVKVRGQVTEWQDQQQISISQIRIVNGGDEVDMADFFERSVRDPEEMWSELFHIVDMSIVDEGVLTLIRRMLLQNKANFCKAPAAKSVHHAYLGGLVEHILDMCNVALPICKNYSLNVDLVLAGCVLHDVGKLFELSYDMGIGYTLEGSMLGHITQGMLLIAKEIDGIENFSAQAKVAILHLVASHHGLLAYGSPRVPLMREAIALNLIDLLSSKMGICARAIKSGINSEGLTDWVKELEGPLWILPEAE